MHVQGTHPRVIQNRCCCNANRKPYFVVRPQLTDANEYPILRAACFMNFIGGLYKPVDIKNRHQVICIVCPLALRIGITDGGPKFKESCNMRGKCLHFFPQ